MTVRPPLTVAGEKTLTSLPAGIVRPEKPRDILIIEERARRALTCLSSGDYAAASKLLCCARNDTDKFIRAQEHYAEARRDAAIEKLPEGERQAAWQTARKQEHEAEEAAAKTGKHFKCPCCGEMRHGSKAVKRRIPDRYHANGRFEVRHICAFCDIRRIKGGVLFTSDSSDDQTPLYETVFGGFRIPVNYAAVKIENKRAGRDMLDGYDYIAEALAKAVEAHGMTGQPPNRISMRTRDWEDDYFRSLSEEERSAYKENERAVDAFRRARRQTAD